MLSFEIGVWSKNSFKNRVFKWGLLVLWLGHLEKKNISYLLIPMELEEVPYIIGKVLEYDIDYVISSFIWTTFDINRNHFQQIVLMPIQLEPATSLIFHLFSTSLPRVEP